jgi:GR25 family glycosyltransferase involved in LPS biosynthesis
MSEHIGLNKLEGFGPIYIINLESREDRKNYIINELQSHNVNDFKIFKAVDGATANWDDLVFDRGSLSLSNSELGATISHLSAIKNWMENSESKYGIIIEDDLSLETVQYWDFSFKTSFHMREHKDWSAACYLITRQWAEKLISKHFIDGKYVFPKDYRALADFIIYNGAKCYSKPLFTYSMNFETSITAPNNTKEDKENPLGIHHISRQDVLSYWKNYGIS